MQAVPRHICVPNVCLDEEYGRLYEEWLNLRLEIEEKTSRLKALRSELDRRNPLIKEDPCAIGLSVSAGDFDAYCRLRARHPDVLAPNSQSRLAYAAGTTCSDGDDRISLRLDPEYDETLRVAATLCQMTKQALLRSFWKRQNCFRFYRPKPCWTPKRRFDLVECRRIPRVHGGPKKTVLLKVRVHSWEKQILKLNCHRWGLSINDLLPPKAQLMAFVDALRVDSEQDAH